MCLLSYILDTVGLFLRIWLWISVPMAVLILLVATWLNYRQHWRPKVGLNLAMEGWAGEALPAAGGPFTGSALSVSAEPQVKQADAGEVQEGRDNVYRGILWMKEKYERYREQADRRYEQLKEELGRSERRYHELAAAMAQVGTAGTVTGWREIGADAEDAAAPAGEPRKAELPTVDEPAAASPMAGERDIRTGEMFARIT